VVSRNTGMWRVYCPQWLIAWTSLATGQGGAAECESEFGLRFRGRVREDDWRVTSPSGSYGRSFLELRLPNCAGEFAGREDAERRAGEHGGHPHQVVEAGSPEEERLLAYGKRRLRA
jgi:hypothetical protein